MTYTKQDIANLLGKATSDERNQLKEALAMSDDTSPHGDALVKQLLWKYQTPLGYLARDPSFDEICVDVAKALKLKNVAEAHMSCWQRLDWIMRNLWKQMIESMDESEQKKVMAKLMSDKEFADAASAKGVDLAKATAGTLLLGIEQLGGFATYRIALIVTNQVAKVLLGRGLSLAANAVLVRTISVALGPVGWLLFAWGINDLMGTNYKCVIPAVLIIYCIYASVKKEGTLPF